VAEAKNDGELGAQVISNSVGNALELCLALNIPQFKGCEATMSVKRAVTL